MTTTGRHRHTEPGAPSPGRASGSQLPTLDVVILRPGARLPERQSTLASGYDLHACLEGGQLRLRQSPSRVPTGLAVAAPPGVDVQVRPRSGLSLRGVMTTLGTLDADYRGELFVTMYCLPGSEGHVLKDGDRIAQLVVSRLEPVGWRVVPELDATARGAGGHGSTGR